MNNSNDSIIDSFKYIRFHPNEFDDSAREELFNRLKKLLEHDEPCNVFSSPEDRESIVAFSERLYENKKFEDILWLVKKFINDPDPSENVEGEDRVSKIHRDIKNGDRSSLPIITVLGNLAWSIQKLALNKETISQALIYTRKILNHKNLYVKYEATLPLVEIAARRSWLSGFNKREYQGEYKQFHEMVFELVELVKKNDKCYAIANRLSDVFSYYNDLSTVEALDALNVTESVEDASFLLLYFAIYRQDQYGDVKGLTFKPELFKTKLLEAFNDNSFMGNPRRKYLAWHIWTLLREQPQEFKKIEPWIDKMLEGPYASEIIGKVQLIISEHIKDHPATCVRWYEEILNKCEMASNDNKQFSSTNIMFSHAFEVIDVVAEKYPEKLLQLMTKLLEFWKGGGVAIDMNKLFGTAMKVKDLIIKNELKVLYEELRTVDPRLPNFY